MCCGGGYRPEHLVHSGPLCRSQVSTVTHVCCTPNSGGNPAGPTHSSPDGRVCFQGSPGHSLPHTWTPQCGPLGHGISAATCPIARACGFSPSLAPAMKKRVGPLEFAWRLCTAPLFSSPLETRPLRAGERLQMIPGPHSLCDRPIQTPLPLGRALLGSANTQARPNQNFTAEVPRGSQNLTPTSKHDTIRTRMHKASRMPSILSAMGVTKGTPCLNRSK